MPMIIQITHVDLLPAGGVVTSWRAVATPSGEVVNAETVEPLNIETVATTNVRIENDAKAKMLAQAGITVTGAIHVFGGRTS